MRMPMMVRMRNYLMIMKMVSYCIKGVGSVLAQASHHCAYPGWIGGCPLSINQQKGKTSESNMGTPAMVVPKHQPQMMGFLRKLATWSNFHAWFSPIWAMIETHEYWPLWARKDSQQNGHINPYWGVDGDLLNELKSRGWVDETGHIIILVKKLILGTATYLIVMFARKSAVLASLWLEKVPVFRFASHM